MVISLPGNQPGVVTSSVASGQVIINGGTVDAKQFLSSTGTASYSQSGGLFILRGRFRRTPVSYASIADLVNVTTATLNTARVANGISTAHGSFNLENAANIFTVSGGTIRIVRCNNNRCGRGFRRKVIDGEY
ncbi:MAG: hypothetical protein MZV63_40930 [Marinilabiliales bacterium]|nr:hypothetical protein [Marinilabiliales bacterium]